MHHFLYPNQDTYLSNKALEKDKNFGLDEMLCVGVSHSYAHVLNTTRTYHFGNEFVAGMELEGYTGRLTGSFYGTVLNTDGTIIGSNTRFTSSYFSGSLSGSVIGTETGSVISTSNFSGSLRGFSGGISSVTVSGYISGSLTASCFSTFAGVVTSSIGNVTGYLTGDEIKQQSNWSVVDRRYINRTLISFDLDFISQSIVRGDIGSPRFKLKLKTTEAQELPVRYSIYAFPVSQSWDQGDGYFADGGSDYGASWNWKDFNSGSSWFLPHTETIITSSVNYLTNYNYVSESFTRGGGTWYNIPCSQSFDYQVSDIDMDVTPIVNAWLSKSIPNYGLILLYDGEVSTTSSNAHIFYFSRETNTIFSPKLDVMWDDSSWNTGSFGTGSVVIDSYNPRISGSIVNGVTISGISVTGSVGGNAYLLINSQNVIDSGSIIDVMGLSETIKGININGTILGTSSLDTNGKRFITASIDSGDFRGCQILGQYSSSMLTGILSGSFFEMLLVDSGISGSVSDAHTIKSLAYQFSSANGTLMGSVISGSNHSGIFRGVATSGPLKGASVYLPFTGSYSYVTSSLSFTSSVQITGSGLQPLDTSNPFVVVVQNLKRQYNFGNVGRIEIFARERFPIKTFGKSPQQLSHIIPKVLPSSSYYSIKDNETEEIIIDFDNYTRLSCDPTGNYFHLDTTGLEQERYYRVLIKVDCDDGTSYTFNGHDIFKIAR
jgi:hypothetical protein